ncbi:MAG: MarR family winged helix-turn-helix transcriptional regulator [Myxococcota bacterium]
MTNEMRWIDDFSEAWAREYPDATDTSGLRLITLLARLSVLIEDFERETLEPFELMPSDYAVLAALRRSGAPYELAPNQLYTALERSSGGMTKMLKRLENLGLVKRVNDPEDRRSKLVRLTPAGKRVEGEAFQAFLTSTHELLRSASRRDLNIIDDAVRSLLLIIERHFYR